MSKYRLAPVEPTQEMLAAGEAASFESISWDTAKWVYEAMLAAAPDVQEEPLADRMRAAGMMTIDEMMAGAPLDRLIRNAGVHDLDSYGEWLDMKCRDFLTMQAKRELNKDPEDDIYEWVIAHAAAFQEARINFNAARHAKPEQQPLQLPDLATDPDDSDEGASLWDHGYKRGWNACVEAATKTMQTEAALLEAFVAQTAAQAAAAELAAALESMIQGADRASWDGYFPADTVTRAVEALAAYRSQK